MALLLVIMICILGGWFNIKLPERKSTIDTSPSLPLLEPLSTSRSLAYWSLSNLREYTDANGDINEGLWSRIPQVISLNNNKQLIRRMKILQDTIIYEETFCIASLARSSKLARPLITTRSHGCSTLSYVTLTQNVSAGNHFYPYIFPSGDFCAFRVYYFDAYMVNLELDDNFKVFFDLGYLYIFTFYRSWPSCNWATYPSVIFYTLVYFALDWIMSVIKSHDKYQSFILIGLALTEKANSGIQYILFHFRSYWRGWRPLVTPGHVV